LADEDDGNWVELLRVHDAVEAEITARFLDDHGVSVRTFGGATSALPTIGLTDLRLLVPRAQVQAAEQALSAMRDGAGSLHPFRNAPPEPYDAPTARRKGPFAFVLALLVPVGAGHFYARHGAAGALFAAGVAGAFVGSTMGARWLAYAIPVLVAIDAVTSPFAVRRVNASRVPNDGRQRVWALGAVALAYGVAFAVGAH
jgi:hypothetical protein